MGIYVVEVFMVCNDPISPENYASDCIGFEPDSVVPFYTADAHTTFCAFTDTKSKIYKVYEFIDWGHWTKVFSPPDIVPCPELEEPDRPRPPPEPPEEPPIDGEEIEISLCLEKIERWQRTPRVVHFPSVRRSEKALLPSLENLGAKRLRNSLSKQRRGLRGGVGTRRINLARRSTIFDAIIQTIGARRYKNILIAQAGSQVALCFTTRSGRTHFLKSNGYRKLLRQLALERRSTK